MTEESSLLVTLKSSIVSFPKLCPNCLSPYPAEKYKTEFSEYLGRTGKIEHYRKTSLDIPLCGACKSNAFRLRNYVILSLVLAVALAAVGLPVTSSYQLLPSDVALNALITAVPLLMALILAYFVSSPVLPIEMFSATSAGTTLMLRNERYAQQFRSSNQPNITEVTMRIVKPRTTGVVLGAIYGAFFLIGALMSIPLVLSPSETYMAPLASFLWFLLAGGATLAGVATVLRGNPWLGRRMVYAGGAMTVIMLIGLVGIAAGAFSLHISQIAVQEPPPPPP